MIDSAGIIVRNQDNKVLLLKPNSKSDQKWSIPKGKIEGAEDPPQAAVRETWEEAGIEADGEALIFLGINIYQHQNKRVHAFVADIDMPEDGVTLNWENKDYSWVTVPEAVHMVHESQSCFFERLRDAKDDHSLLEPKVS